MMKNINLSSEFINIIEAIKSSGAETVDAKNFVEKKTNLKLPPYLLLQKRLNK